MARRAPAGLTAAFVKVFPMSGDDEPKLTPANENPCWYWLATVYGEQEEGANESEKVDQDLAAKNRVAWNRWIADALTDKQRAELVTKGFDASELTPLLDEEQTEFLKQFAARAGHADAEPPEPTDEIDFKGVRFERPVVLNRFLFPRFADFKNAAFSSRADFREAAFLDYADFRDAAFSNYALFRDAAFSGSANFKAAKFKSHTIFAGANFQTTVPDFRDAKLSEATEWHGAEWPPPPEEKEAAQQQVYAYERLKLEMERLKKHSDEQFFFAKELRARRVLEPPGSPKWLLNWAYETFSFYGQSVTRPLLWLAAVWAFGVSVFTLWPPLNTGHMKPWDTAALSATNLFSFLPYEPDKAITDCLSAAAKIIGDLQSVLGLVLLFLLGLALRNLFRMK
jgi:uncharacterized protein YjbI with pentapeptide repeats